MMQEGGAGDRTPPPGDARRARSLGGECDISSPSQFEQATFWGALNLRIRVPASVVAAAAGGTALAGHGQAHEGQRLALEGQLGQRMIDLGERIPGGATGRQDISAPSATTMHARSLSSASSSSASAVKAAAALCRAGVRA